MLGGVSKSGSPISRWMMSLPWASSARARFRTSNSVSVPSRDMRSANRSSNWRARDIRQNGLLYYAAHLTKRCGIIETMFAPSTVEIQKALERLADGLGRYQWLQAEVLKCNATTDREFQRRFTAFYRVRRNSEWRREFFALMEMAKSGGIEFSEALRAIHRSTGRIEASFASKMVATLDPSKPVIDKFVLRCFKLRLPKLGLAGSGREHN